MDRPYFVMEHVPGVPITEYCDQNELSTRARLELFILVCTAVRARPPERASFTGTSSRQNILVTVQDGGPVPKVIDFGIAKATRQRLTEKTIFTHLGLLIGTPEYMSPEQAETGSDRYRRARTDIYSLGCSALRAPGQRTAVRSDGVPAARGLTAEIQRIIREEQPVPPSTRLSDLGDKAADSRRNDARQIFRPWVVSSRETWTGSP